MEIKKYLIFQFAAFGDCLYATTIAKQIKFDNPKSHITWAIATKYKSVLDNNPDVDVVWELMIDPRIATAEELNQIDSEIQTKKDRGDFDEVIHTQIMTRHLNKFYTTLRQTVFDIYGKPIAVNIQPVIKLSTDEINNVKVFATEYNLKNFKDVVLFECSPTSNQSKINIQAALDIAKQITKNDKEICFILSSPSKLKFEHNQIFDASSLTFRENAELTHYCTLLIGCSSGITWISTSVAGKKLPMIQLLDNKSEIFAGVNFDFYLNKLNNNHIIEMLDYSSNSIVECIHHVRRNGVEAARKKFNEDYKPNYYNLEFISFSLLWNKHSFSDVLKFSRKYLENNAEVGNNIVINKYWYISRLYMQMFKKAKFDLKSNLKTKLKN